MPPSHGVTIKVTHVDNTPEAALADALASIDDKAVRRGKTCFAP
jgi:hypothetical protein